MVLTLLLDDFLGRDSERLDKDQGPLNHGAEGGDLLIAEEVPLRVVVLIESFESRSQVLHVDFDVLAVHLADTEKNLLTIHGESLLEKLDVLSFTDSNQHILEGSQGILLDLG